MSVDNVHGSSQDGGLPVQEILEKNNVADPDTPLTEAEIKETKRLVRKIDMRLLPTLAVIYAFALIDRVNLPNVCVHLLSTHFVRDVGSYHQARIAGMDTDLGLSIGSRYSILTMIFFIPYIIFQFPANIVIRKLGPALWLPSLVVIWGAVTIGMGFVTSWTQALGLRVLLGVLEAGYYPGCVFLLSCWYVRWEVQKRFSGFYLLALLASGFSNILAWGLSEMKGISGLNGWQWIFAIVSSPLLQD